MFNDLSYKELEALKIIRNFLVHQGKMPSVRELMLGMEYKSPRSAALLLKNLEIKNANIKLEFNNEFPCNCCINLRLSSGDLINSSPICINSAQTDLLGNLMQSTISQYQINIGNNVLEKLQNSDKLIIDLVLTSPDSVTNFPILGIQNLYYSRKMITIRNFPISREVNINQSNWERR